MFSYLLECGGHGYADWEVLNNQQKLCPTCSSSSSNFCMPWAYIVLMVKAACYYGTKELRSKLLCIM